ncbi:glycoside hydrolase/deacetylase [Saitoella complicata NRRL Y-17804]|nr:glycoside hydrolase/deacetylase [Saitoella complicata NRRL Y-17804]ODQ56199.1 glycoside hydrolase/deacetylase [Saitoella complicata NRRL Y-17804]
MVSLGCQSGYGECDDDSDSDSSTSNASITGQCGSGSPGNWTCPDSQCCSGAGWCGTGAGYCDLVADDCQAAYGVCDAEYIPSGANTSSVDRTLLGSVPYGTWIYDCVTAGEVAVTYDDGPYLYTDAILDLFDQYNAKATFFITGNNIGKGPIDDSTYGWDTIIKRQYASGHQIASHTWTHPDLSTLADADMAEQMILNEMALRNIIGVFPTYMRPPYSSCEDNCQRVMQNLGYHIVDFDLDTDDYNNVEPSLIQNSKDIVAEYFDGREVSSTSSLVIAHDIHEQTINLTSYALELINAAGYKMVTVGQCLGDDQANWYRSS